MWLSQGAGFDLVGLPLVRSGPKTVWAMIAPTLPEAADRPCEVERLAGWKTFTRYDESWGVVSAVMSGSRGRLTCCIGSEIEEELGKDI